MKKYLLKETYRIIIIGLVVGVVIALYKYCAHLVISCAKYLYLSNDITMRLIFLIISIIIMFIGYRIVKYDGNIQTSGLPQIDLHIKHKTRQIKWYKSLPLMFVSSLISFFNGLPVGSEAPSLFLSAMVSMGLTSKEKNEMCKQENDEDVYISMGAGFAAAFFTPLASVCYIFEEFLEKVKIKNIIKLIAVSLIATIVSYFINNEKIITIELTTIVELKDYLLIIPFIIFMFIIAFVMKRALIITKKFINNHYQNIIIRNRYFIIMILSIIIINTIPILGGSGIDLIKNTNMNTFWYIILIYLVVRIILCALASNCMASGGSLLPLFAIGALAGMLFVKICGLENDKASLYILYGMTILFAFVNKAPLTGLALTISFVGLSNCLDLLIYSLIITTFVYLIVKVLKIESINDKRTKLLRTSRKYNNVGR